MLLSKERYNFLLKSYTDDELRVLNEFQLIVKQTWCHYLKTFFADEEDKLAGAFAPS
jgi:hypothetical protein